MFFNPSDGYEIITSYVTPVSTYTEGFARVVGKLCCAALLRVDQVQDRYCYTSLSYCPLPYCPSFVPCSSPSVAVRCNSMGRDDVSTTNYERHVGSSDAFEILPTNSESDEAATTRFEQLPCTQSLGEGRIC